MINLAGKTDCDIWISEELAEARIPMKRIKKENTEVPYSIIGKLGSTEFRRGWYCWIVKCHIPLKVAEKIYATNIGKRDIRAAGHCGCVDPKERNYMGFVHGYHIDSQEGLNLFVDFIN